MVTLSMLAMCRWNFLVNKCIKSILFVLEGGGLVGHSKLLVPHKPNTWGLSKKLFGNGGTKHSETLPLLVSTTKKVRCRREVMETEEPWKSELCVRVCVCDCVCVYVMLHIALWCADPGDPSHKTCPRSSSHIKGGSPVFLSSYCNVPKPFPFPCL